MKEVRIVVRISKRQEHKLFIMRFAMHKSISRVVREAIDTLYTHHLESGAIPRDMLRKALDDEDSLHQSDPE